MGLNGVSWRHIKCNEAKQLPNWTFIHQFVLEVEDLQKKNNGADERRTPAEEARRARSVRRSSGSHGRRSHLLSSRLHLLQERR